MKELARVNLWERRVSNAIAAGKEDKVFPQIADYGISREDLDDYVVEKAYLLDCLEQRKSSFVVPGALLILPVILISMFTFTDSVMGLFIGVATGVAFASAYMLTLNAIDRRKLNKIYDEKIEQYIDDILEYNK